MMPLTTVVPVRRSAAVCPTGCPGFRDQYVLLCSKSIYSSSTNNGVVRCRKTSDPLRTHYRTASSHETLPPG